LAAAVQRGCWSRLFLLHRFGPADEFGPRREKLFFNPKQFSFNIELNLNPEKILRTSENYESFPGGRLKYLEQLLYWSL
jgi:hypothetical protein